jgi:hypothetical protein
VANPRSRKRIARIFPAHADLISGESARNLRHNLTSCFCWVARPTALHNCFSGFRYTPCKTNC